MFQWILVFSVLSGWSGGHHELTEMFHVESLEHCEQVAQEIRAELEPFDVTVRHICIRVNTHEEL